MVHFLSSPRGNYPYIFPPKKKIFFLGQTRENKSYKSAKLLGYSPRPADLTDTGQLPITSRHYGFKSTETSNSTASSRRRRRRRRRQQQPQRLLCNSHSLLILHRHICHGTYYIKLYQLLTQYINILPPPLLFFIAIFIIVITFFLIDFNSVRLL